MRIGVTIFQTDRLMNPVELAQAAEVRGFHSLYLPEHTHIPVSRRTPWPMGRDEELPEAYSRVLDPFISLAAAASVTERIILGTGISIVAEHDPVSLAKAVASLDFLSGGRFVLGTGFGWNKEEMAGHGVDFAQRREVTREYILAMQSLWRDEVSEFRGEYVDLEPSWAFPKAPGVRTLLGGGAGPKLFAAIAEYADGWLPVGGAGLAEALPKLRAAFEARGRDPQGIDVIPFGTLPSAEKLDYYRGLGCTEVVLRLPEGGRDEVLPVLDDFVKYMV